MRDNSSELEEFLKEFKMVTFKKGESVIRPEQNLDCIYYLKSGLVRMYSVSGEGKELTFNIFKPGTYFPMTWAIGEIPNNYFFETMVESELAKVPTRELISYLKDKPELLFDLTRRILVGMAGTLVRMEYLMFGGAYSRVASTLLLSARRFGRLNKKGETEIELPLTHQEIANQAGLTRESVSIEMQKMAKKNLVTARKRKLIVPDMDKLQEESLIYIDGNPLPFTY